MTRGYFPVRPTEDKQVTLKDASKFFQRNYYWLLHIKSANVKIFPTPEKLGGWIHKGRLPDYYSLLKLYDFFLALRTVDKQKRKAKKTGKIKPLAMKTTYNPAFIDFDEDFTNSFEDNYENF